ncbi:MAG: pyridoxal phosphate-dependent aminotransferase [bacterium]
MPRFPNFAARVHQITGSVFETYRSKMAAQGDRLIRLHIGDTYLPTRYALPFEPETFPEYNDYNRYCNTFGIEPLRDALVEKLKTDNHLEVGRDNILVTCGITNGLSISMMALAEPGDEILILTPAWPFFFGMVKLAGARVVEAPLYTRLFEQPELDIAGTLEQVVSPRTAAIYLNTPNNPSGKVMSLEQVQQVAEFAQKHNLWLISDEAYDGLTFDDLPHISAAALPDMFERTLTMFTFSKSFMFAGLRLGFVVGNETVVKNLNKIMVHQLYSPSTLAQQMMVAPVKTRQQWLPAVRAHYQELRDLFVQHLEIDFPTPEGTYFIFFPAGPYLKNRDIWHLIEACLDSGVSVAPGDSFGRDFGQYIRLCFTGESPERLETGIERLNAVFNGR